MYITEENADRLVDVINMEMGKIMDMPELSKDALCLLGEMVDILKDLKEIDGENSGYSNRGYSMRHNYNTTPGYSTRRGRRSYDSERDNILSKMERFMDQASNESERQLVQRIMDSI